MKRKIFGMLFAVAVLVTSMGITAFAEQNQKVEMTEDEKQDDELAAASTVVRSGTCGADGDNLTWELTEDGVLTISGTGSMEDYDFFNDYDAPWPDEEVEIVKIGEGQSR